MKRVAVHLGLFVAACVSTWVTGGAVFAATLMAILVTHEMGHYVLGHVARSVILVPPCITLGLFVSDRLARRMMPCLSSRHKLDSS